MDIGSRSYERIVFGTWIRYLRVCRMQCHPNTHWQYSTGEPSTYT